MSTVRGLTWAMETPNSRGLHLYAVVGNTLFIRSPSYLWCGASYDGKKDIDSMILATTERMEALGGMLVVGPAEFEVPSSVFEEGDLPDQQVGEVAERALGLRGVG